MPSAPITPATPAPGQVVIEIVRLLDMPMQEKFFSNDLKQYRVRVFDDFHGEIGRTQELAGIPENFGAGEDMDTETLRLGPEGILRLQSDSPVLHLQVEYAGGFMGNLKIGRCRIARADQRSREIWPYALSDKNDEMVGCGIELKVLEGGPPMPGGTPPMSMRSGMPMSGPMGTMGPSAMPGTPPSPSFRTMPPTGPGMLPGSGPMQPSFQTMPPMDMMFGKGKGKGMMPPMSGTPPMPPGGPSFRTMPPQGMPPQLQPQMFPNFGGNMPGGGGQVVKSAWQGGTDSMTGRVGGKDVTMLINQFIQSNGVMNPTRGSSMLEIFGNNEDLTVWGPTTAQRDEFGGRSMNDIPLVFKGGTPPPYNLQPLFMGQHPASGTFSHQGAPVPVVAIIELDKIIDIPAPSGGGDGEVTLTLERFQGGKQLSSTAPFKTEVQGNLRQATNLKGKLACRLTLEDLAKGAVQLCVSAHYKGSWLKFGNGQRIGTSAPFSVSWKPEPTQYVPIYSDQKRSGGGGVAVGGIYISHRFAQDSEDLYKSMRNGPEAPEQAKAKAADKNTSDINGITGNYKKGSQDEVIEYAALAVEGQNRALHQRIKLATTAQAMNEERKTNRDESALTWRLPNSYRDWKDLDAVFITFGPNYVAQSSEVGPSICRVYQENTSVWKELMSKESPLGVGNIDDVDEQIRMKKLLFDMTGKDPEEVTSTLRPLVCKDVSSIERDGSKNVNQKPKLRINVRSALNLRAKAGFMKGEVHPKVIIEIPGKPGSKWESKPATDSKNVQWDEEGTITGYDYGDDLKITVVDKAFIGFEDHLGEVRLPGMDFYPEPFYAQLPLLNGGTKSNTNPETGSKAASILLEVQVIEPLGKSEQWPPSPAIYAPMKNLNQSDQETQRLANWDTHQNSKIAFADVNPNYTMNEDIWGACSTKRSIEEGSLQMHKEEWQPTRVKDECLMA